MPTTTEAKKGDSKAKSQKIDSSSEKKETKPPTSNTKGNPMKDKTQATQQPSKDKKPVQNQTPSDGSNKNIPKQQNKPQAKPSAEKAKETKPTEKNAEKPKEQKKPDTAKENHPPNKVDPKELKKKEKAEKKKAKKAEKKKLVEQGISSEETSVSLNKSDPSNAKQGAAAAGDKKSSESQKPKLQVDQKKLEELSILAKGVRTGGKGTVRRKFKEVRHNVGAVNDQKLQDQAKKMNFKTIPDIEEVSFWMDDNTSTQFSKPKVQALMGSNAFIITGKAEKKSEADSVVSTLQNLGASPEQLRELAKKVSEARKSDEADEIPDLTSFEGKTPPTANAVGASSSSGATVESLDSVS